MVLHDTIWYGIKKCSTKETLKLVEEDIVKQIESHYFVPVYIFEDGCRSFTVRIDEEISEREKQYICVQSEEYLLKSTGKVIIKSGVKPEMEYRTKINTFSEDD